MKQTTVWLFADTPLLQIQDMIEMKQTQAQQVQQEIDRARQDMQRLETEKNQVRERERKKERKRDTLLLSQSLPTVTFLCSLRSRSRNLRMNFSWRFSRSSRRYLTRSFSIPSLTLRSYRKTSYKSFRSSLLCSRRSCRSSIPRSLLSRYLSSLLLSLHYSLFSYRNNLQS